MEAPVKAKQIVPRAPLVISVGTVIVAVAVGYVLQVVIQVVGTILILIPIWKK